MKWYLESFQQGKRIVLILFYFYYYYFFCKERDLSLTIKMVSVLSKENTVKLLLRVSLLVIYSRNLLPMQKKNTDLYSERTWSVYSRLSSWLVFVYFTSLKVA